VNSPPQLQHILFDVLKLPTGKKTKTGYSTDVSVLENLSLEHDLPRLILDYRHLAKMKSTYVDALPQMIHPQTGRIHTSFNQTITETGHPYAHRHGGVRSGRQHRGQRHAAHGQDGQFWHSLRLEPIWSGAAPAHQQ